MQYLDFLDPEQKAAATADDGNIRVMAGAGTGKTTTLIARLLFLLCERKVAPREILVVTFTNKAAEEVKHRLSEACARLGLSRDIPYQVRIGTFHSHCARFLRRIAPRIGLAANFTIADDEDSALLIDEILYDSRFYERQLGFVAQPDGGDIEKQRKSFHKAKAGAIRALKKDVVALVSRWKENGLDRRFLDTANLGERDEFERDVAEALYEYEEALARRAMVDFTDLIGRTCRALEDDPKLLTSASSSVRHLLVDEFQDVNRQQKRLVDLLSSVHGNLFVVGDPDQSIYGFRGSTPQIMEQMSGAAHRDITLRSNRRSTREILAVANRLVEANLPGRKKLLDSDRNGRTVELFNAQNEYAEAGILTKKVQGLLARGQQANEIAVLVRTANAAKAVETAFLKRKVPYTLVSGLSFVEREEVKDMISYLRLLLNPHDDLSFIRVINKPSRGLGPAAAKNLRDFAHINSISLLEACQEAAAGGGGFRLTTRGVENLSLLNGLLDEAKSQMEEGEIEQGLRVLIFDSGYYDWLKQRDEHSAFRKRYDNLRALMSMSREYSELFDFLDNLSLASDTSEVEAPDRVVISTIHAAKGREFDYVFCPAFEQGHLPHSLSLDEDTGDIDLEDVWSVVGSGGLHEERRLGHVALTRARHHLVISHANKRNGRGARPSEFLATMGLGDHTPRAPEPEQERNDRPRGGVLARTRRKGKPSAASDATPPLAF